MTDGAATVSTCVCVIMAGYVIACQGRVCVPRATQVPRVKTGVQMEPSEVDANTLVCVSTAPAVSTTQECVCVRQDTQDLTASEVRTKTITMADFIASQNTGIHICS